MGLVGVLVRHRAVGASSKGSSRTLLSMVGRFRWLKGHGTENDFLLLPDFDGSVHGALDAELVRALCHRRRGIGADGVLRAVRSRAYDDPAAREAADAGAEWFMDYRNADGSLSQMCGNGLRLFALFLAYEGLVDSTQPVRIGTRGGPKTVRWCDDGRLTVDMGVGRALGEVKVGVGSRSWSAVRVDMGNPHAVAVVESLDDAGPPSYDAADFPEGVNVEFAVRGAESSGAMRVFERGVGETRSCGTGACAVAIAIAGDVARPVTVGVRTLGGPLEVTIAEGGRIELTGPAVLVAEGSYPLADNSGER